MKKTVTLLWLLFVCFMAYSTPPEKNDNKKTIKNSALLPYSTLDLDDDFIYPAWGFYFDVSPGISNISNNNLPSVMNAKSGLGYALNVGYFHSVSPWIKLKTGVGITSYKKTLTANGEAPQQTFQDIDDDTYTETLTLNDVEKTSNPMYLSVPLIFEFGNPNIDKPGFYADLGLKYSFLINENYSYSGTYSTKGTYEQWNVTLENVPELGFYDNQNQEASAEFKKNNFSIVAGAGVFIPVSSVIIFKGGLVTNWGLTDIGNNKAENTNPNVIGDEIYSFRARYIDNSLAVTRGSRTFHLGIEFGLYISHRLK